jgi:RimJ/RimL family protein N-acetyltransferase
MEGKLVRLRGFEKSDLDSVMRFINDEELKRFLGVTEALRYPLSRLQEENWIEQITSASGPERIFAIETLDRREFLGHAGLEHLDWVDRRTNLSLFIYNRDNWSRGYGSDALGILMRLVFDRLGLYRLGLRVAASNERAIRCYERAGFRREGVLRCDRFLDGRLQDSLVMSILEPEYRATHPAPAMRA